MYSWVHGLNKLFTFSILRLIEPKFLGWGGRGGWMDVSQRRDRLESWPWQNVEYRLRTVVTWSIRRNRSTVANLKVLSYISSSVSNA